MIKRHRSRMMPGNVGYSDAPTFAGFSSKSPCSDHAMELGDLEAAFVGNVARYCMVMGTIPPFSLRGLWWVNGECKGLGVVDWDTDVEPIIPLIRHMQHYAPFIVGTEGVEDMLQAGKETRWYSEKMFPRESSEWVGIDEACKITGRAKKTINDWRREGWVEALDDRYGVMYSREGLETIMEMRDAAAKARADNARSFR